MDNIKEIRKKVTSNGYYTRILVEKKRGNIVVTFKGEERTFSEIDDKFWGHIQYARTTEIADKERSLKAGNSLVVF